VRGADTVGHFLLEHPYAQGYLVPPFQQAEEELAADVVGEIARQQKRLGDA